MKLYLVIHIFEYEGGLLSGVFDNKEDAQKRLIESKTGDASEVVEIDLNSNLEFYI